MRDSRIGAYGAVALALVLILRAAALASALEHGFFGTAAGLIQPRLVERSMRISRTALSCLLRLKAFAMVGPAVIFLVVKITTARKPKLTHINARLRRSAILATSIAKCVRTHLEGDQGGPRCIVPRLAFVCAAASFRRWYGGRGVRHTIRASL